MNKVAQYLQEHVLGEVVSSADVRKHFSTDGSVLKLSPALVMYPRNESDVRKAARFTWQLAERGRILPITPRGSGTDQSGGAIGNGVILVFPAHMNRILELDSKGGTVTVEPGTNYGKLQQTLETHERFLPPYPASIEYTTIGGAIANNTSGEKSVKYGDTRTYTKSLRVVLANGEVIKTERLNKRELSKKLGLSTFEGEIYRAVDTLLEEHHELVQNSKLSVTKNVAGYDVFNVRQKDGSFDLTPLFVGSQGTLGIITEATLEVEPYNPLTTLVTAYFGDLKNACDAVQELRKLKDMPSIIEMVDENLLNFVSQQNPSHLKNIVEEPLPKVVLFIEFDNPGERSQKRAAKKATKLLERYGARYTVEADMREKDKFRKVRQSSSVIMAHTEGNSKAVPFIEDGIVPVDKLEDYIKGIYELFDKHHIRIAMWGHAGDANLHLQPSLDLSQLGDRQKLFKLMEEYYALVIGLGGSISGEHGEGRIKGPYLEQLYGSDTYNLFIKLKQIFDPYNTLNPGVKVGVSLDEVKALLRQEYDMGYLHQHLPRS